jgi:uncharacterized protein YndB with AHSA1/START domain
MQVVQSVDIAAPPQAVWAYLDDPEKVLVWYLPCETFEYIGDHKGALGAHLLFEEKLPVGSFALKCVITEWVDGEVIAFEAEEGGLIKRYAERWSLAPTPSGSRFTLALDYEFPWKVANTLLGPVIQRNSAVTVERILERLKGLAEG